MPREAETSEEYIQQVSEYASQQQGEEVYSHAQ